MPLSRPQRDILVEALAVAFTVLADEATVALSSGSLAETLADRVAARLRVETHGHPAAALPRPQPFLTQREAAAYSGRSISSIRRARDGGLPFARVGGNVVFERAILDAWLRGELTVTHAKRGASVHEGTEARGERARGPPSGTASPLSNPLEDSSIQI